ncbi:MAG: hypothetical protein ABFC96_17875 [Thermoguttaceae bacterium]
MVTANSCVGEFADALRQFADYLENEPEMAVLDSGGDLFVACTDLVYDDRFMVLLRSDRENLEGMIGNWDFGRLLYAFCGWCGAVARLAVERKRAGTAADVGEREGSAAVCGRIVPLPR